MSENDDEVPESGDYLVGYKKPPKATQFSKGETGNPRGRPRKPKPEERTITFSDAPYDAAFREEIYRKLKLRENGEEVELLVPQAIMRARIMSALKGNRFAQKAILEELERKEQEYFQRKIDRCIYLNRAKREGERKLAEAKKNNTEPPKLLPHPDDIVVNLSTGNAYVTGPETEEELKFCEYTVCLRDHLLLREVHEGNLFRSSGRPDKLHINFLLMAMIFNAALPKRFRWNPNESEETPVSITRKRHRKILRQREEIDLAFEFHAMTRQERRQRIAEEEADLIRTRPRASIDMSSPKVQKIQRALERIIIEKP